MFVLLWTLLFDIVLCPAIWLYLHCKGITQLLPIQSLNILDNKRNFSLYINYLLYVLYACFTPELLKFALKVLFFFSWLVGVCDHWVLTISCSLMPRITNFLWIKIYFSTVLPSYLNFLDHPGAGMKYGLCVIKLCYYKICNFLKLKNL